MTSHRGRPQSTRAPDIILIWSLACAELHVIKTDRDCDACGYRNDCQKKADKLIDRELNATFGRKGKRRHVSL